MLSMFVALEELHGKKRLWVLAIPHYSQGIPATSDVCPYVVAKAAGFLIGMLGFRTP